MQQNQILLDFHVPLDELWACLPDRNFFNNLDDPTVLSRRQFHGEDLARILAVLKIDKPVIECSIYKFPPQCFSHKIHIDRNLYRESILPDVALNIPLSPNKDTFMIWYKQLDESKSFRDYGCIGNLGTPQIFYEDIIEIERQELVRPHLVNIIQWHHVKNYSTTDDAYLMTIRFEKQYTHEDVLQFLKINF